MTAPGWYPHPKGKALLVWWDGTKWTARMKPMPPTPVEVPTCGYQQCTEIIPADSWFCDKHRRLIDRGQRRNQKHARRTRELATTVHGPINPHLVCPHCQTAGAVRAKRVTTKQGVSGGKATAAIMTNGLSLVATGLSRKQGATACRCDNCRMSWLV
jgi:hypothetical protein